MGSRFSVSVLTNVSQFLCFQESYIHRLEENLEAIDRDMEELKARQTDVWRRVEREEDTKGYQRLADVKVWLKNVDSVSRQVSDLLSNKTTELERLSLSGLCSKNLRSNSSYGERVSLMLKKVNDLKSKGDFRVVAEPATKEERLESTDEISDVSSLERLESINIDISSSSALDQLFSAHGLADSIEELCISDVQEEAYKTLVLPTMKSLSKLIIMSCEIWEIKVGRTPWDIILTRSRLKNLSSVMITGCNGLKDMTWLLYVPNLTHLKLECLEKVEGIISKEKVASTPSDEQRARGMSTPFQKLERLELVNLPMLKRIYCCPLLFPCLKKIEVEKCPKLRKLPLNSESCVGGEELVINYRDDQWFKRVRWEDKATEDRFLPCCEKC